MPIGSVERFNLDTRELPSLKRLVLNLYYRIYGTPDLHTHIRWRAIKKQFLDIKARSVLDIGCGAGIISLELALKAPWMKVVGIDLDKEAIKRANSIKKTLKLTNVEFQCMDATTIYPYQDNYFDLVLLIDIIEHISNPQMLIANVSRVLKPGGNVIISVPTPNYPKFFGYKFHKEIGHVRDGYWHEEVEDILKQHKICIEAYSYYTYYPAALVCAVFYRYLRSNKWGILTSPFLNIISYLDTIWTIQSKDYACSLVIKARKKE